LYHYNSASILREYEAQVPLEFDFDREVGAAQAEYS
jgi:hypothetical protein